MRIFIAGIMQGSHREAALHDQDYRPVLQEALACAFTDADVYDPLADHRESLEYDPQQARRVFLQHNEMCREVDLLVAFVPHASMGTAIEMWEAYRAGVPVITISPLEHNWAIRFTSDLIYPTIEEFVAEAKSGRLAQKLAELSVN